MLLRACPMRASGRFTRLFSTAVLLLVGCVVGCRAPTAKSVVPAPAETCPPPGVTRYIVGGDARDDIDHVVPRAFDEARRRCASGFFFLGDMELTPQMDSAFQRDLDALKSIPFYPTIGNHEVVVFGTQFGTVRRLERWLDADQIQENVDTFARRFLGSMGAPVARAPLRGQIAFSVNVENIHWISLDNVSQPGFGAKQLAWLADDLKAADADPAKRWIVVGMHKALYDNGTTTHAMGDPTEGNTAEELAAVIAESNTALALFKQYGVKMVFASHEHLYAQLDSRKSEGIPSYITGGMGAPLKHPAPPNARAQHHILQLDASSEGLVVTPIWFDGPQTTSSGADDDDRALQSRRRGPGQAHRTAQYAAP